MNRLSRSFFAYPIFGFFAAALSGTAFAHVCDALRGGCRYFFAAAVALVAVDVFAGAFLYFGIGAKNARLVRRLLRVVAFFFLCAALFWVRVEPAPQTEFPPTATGVVCRVLEVSRTQRGTVYGVAKVAESAAFPEICGREIWFGIAAAKSSAAAVPEVSAGDVLKISGVLRRVCKYPPTAWGFVKSRDSEASFNGYLLGRFIYCKIFAYADEVRIVSKGEPSFGAGIARFISEKLSGVSFGFSKDGEYNRALRSMVLGDKSLLSPENKRVFKDAGAMHVFAVSGLHVGVAALAAYFFCSLLGVPFAWRPVFALPLLFLYVCACGFPPSAVRAFVMVGVFWAAMAFSRGSGAMNALMLSATLAVMLSPKVLFSAGFQLSYSVVATLFLFSLDAAKKLDVWYFYKTSFSPRLGRLRGAFASFAGGFVVALGAACVAAPISAHCFGAFSVSGMAVSPFLVGLASVAVSLSAFAVALPWGLSVPFATAATACVALMSEISKSVSLYLPPPLEVGCKNGVVCALVVVFALLFLFIVGKLEVWSRCAAVLIFLTSTLFVLWIFR